MRQFADTRVFIGNLEDAGDKKLLKEHDIKVILNVCSDIDTPYHSEIVLLKVGLDDPKEGLARCNPVELAVAVLGMAEHLAYAQEGNVLVHCAAGNNRSPLIAAIWRSEDCHRVSLRKAVKIAQVKDMKPWMVNLGYRW